MHDRTSQVGGIDEIVEYYGTALQAASYGGHERVVRLLLVAQADVKANSGRPAVDVLGDKNVYSITVDRNVVLPRCV